MPAAETCGLLLFADVLLVPGVMCMKKNTLGKELETVGQSLTDNKLSLHLVKTESILFGAKRKVSKIINAL